mgnify:CR=1 FL=1
MGHFLWLIDLFLITVYSSHEKECPDMDSFLQSDFTLRSFSVTLIFSGG